MMPSYPAIITDWPDGRYTCVCQDGECNVDSEEVEETVGPQLVKNPPNLAKMRFNGHWQVTDAGLRFVIDQTWLETK